MSLEKIFKETPLELQVRAEYMAGQTNDFQIIKAYMSNRFNDLTRLTPAQEIKMKRWQFVYDQRSTGKYTDHDIRSQLVNHFAISEHDAWDDIRKAQELYATTLHFNKKFEMMMDLQVINIMREKARAANDMDAFAKLQKVKNDITKMMPDEEETPGDYFKAIELRYEFNPELMGKTRVPNDKMKSLIEMLAQEHGITDIDYTLVNDDNGESSTTSE